MNSYLSPPITFIHDFKQIFGKTAFYVDEYNNDRPDVQIQHSEVPNFEFGPPVELRNETTLGIFTFSVLNPSLFTNHKTYSFIFPVKLIPFAVTLLSKQRILVTITGHSASSACEMYTKIS